MRHICAVKPGAITYAQLFALLRGCRFLHALPAILVVLVLFGCDPPERISDDGPLAEWPQWGGSQGGTRFSPLTQITSRNVKQLRVAWTYRMGGPPRDRKAGWFLEVTPIVAEGRMYLCSPLNKVMALDPESGRELWAFDPQIDRRQVTSHFNCRGVTFYRDDRSQPDSACSARILTGTLDGRLIALDAATGKVCSDFGDSGTVNLKRSLGNVRPGEYNVTSPPTVAAHQVITSAHVSDTARVNAPAGVIRAYDARTGALTWAWNPLPPGRGDMTQSPEEGAYTRGTPNAWSTFSVDAERGLVFVPTGNPTSDFYGGNRNGLDYYGSSVVALDAATGRVVWHFQAVHHDVWGYDVAAQPVLIEYPTTHGRIPAVAQATKQGHIYILHRETGEPLIPVEERPVPQTGAVAGEALSPTQPFPKNPAYVLYPGDLTEEKMWGFTPFDRIKCRDKFRSALNQGLYTPPSAVGSVVFPGPGMINWGGIAVDSSRDILIVNTTQIAVIDGLLPAAASKETQPKEISDGKWLIPIEGSPYSITSELLESPFGAPCTRPPWGSLVAIDLNANKRLWEIPLGTTRDQAPFPIWLNLGVPSAGGPIVTKSGLTFIAATSDNFIRAFDTATGEKLWQARLPAGGQAVPMTYRLNSTGKQYLVIAAGGHEAMGTTLGDYVIAYALP